MNSTNQVVSSTFICKLRRLALVSSLASLATMSLAQTQPTPAIPSAASATASCPPVPATPTQDQVRKAQSEARDRGVLWKLSKDGRVSYLYGTLHIGKFEWIFPGPKLREALSSSDTIALELDITDPKVRQEIAQAMMVPSAPLDEATKKRIAKQTLAACLPEAALAQMHPLMQVVTLTIMQARWEGFDAGYGSEGVLATVAKAAGKQVVSLETAKRQFDALLPADRAGLEPELLRSGLDQLEKGSVRPVVTRMARAWEQGDLADLENHASWCNCMNSEADRDFNARVNDARNPSLAASIDALHREGKKVFAAVGAMHMTGKAAIPKLMTERGYTVERVSFSPAKP